MRTDNSLINSANANCKEGPRTKPQEWCNTAATLKLSTPNQSHSIHAAFRVEVGILKLERINERSFYLALYRNVPDCCQIAHSIVLGKEHLRLSSLLQVVIIIWERRLLVDQTGSRNGSRGNRELVFGCVCIVWWNHREVYTRQEDVVMPDTGLNPSFS